MTLHDDTQTRPALDVIKAAPEAAKALAQLNAAADHLATTAGLDAQLVELVQIRASQINGCAFCVRAHLRKAEKAGVSADRIGLVATWREADYYSALERAALELTEAVTHISSTGVPLELASRLRGVLDDAQYAAVVWVAIGINASNRAVLTGHPHVAP